MSPRPSLLRRLACWLAPSLAEHPRPAPPRRPLPPPPPWLTPESLAALRYTPDAPRHMRWRAAFQFYNEHHPDRPLSMACRPCYEKVRAYLGAVLAAHLQPR